MSRGRGIAVVLLVALAAGLLVAAAALSTTGPEPGSTAPPPPPAPSSEPAPAGPGARLERSKPRPAPSGDGTASPSGGSAPDAAPGRRLPPQWPDFRPTVLRLGASPAAPVDPVDVVGGALELPSDADRVGWWRGGARAGTPFGTVVVAGHLDSRTDPSGYLAGLAVLRPGDRVRLSAPGHAQSYRVVRNYLLPSADISARSDLFAQQRRHRLLLVTCGGPYDHERGRYLDNRVVEAVPVG